LQLQGAFFALICGCFLSFGFCAQAQGCDVDRRGTDEIILLDVSGSMVRDIRLAMLKNKLAMGMADNDLFRLIPGVTIEEVLANPAILPVVQNNLLHKVITYVEAVIDQPGERRIFIATFDDCPRVLGLPSRFPKLIKKGFLARLTYNEMTMMQILRRAEESRVFWRRNDTAHSPTLPNGGAFLLRLF